jgi:hypothetical protein
MLFSRVLLMLTVSSFQMSSVCIGLHVSAHTVLQLQYKNSYACIMDATCGSASSRSALCFVFLYTSAKARLGADCALAAVCMCCNT